MKKIFEILGRFFVAATIYQMGVDWLAKNGYLKIDKDGFNMNYDD